MVEQPAVNRRVVGSSPTFGANFYVLVCLQNPSVSLLTTTIVGTMSASEFAVREARERKHSKLSGEHFQVTAGGTNTQFVHSQLMGSLLCKKPLAKPKQPISLKKTQKKTKFLLALTS